MNIYLPNNKTRSIKIINNIKMWCLVLIIYSGAVLYSSEYYIYYILSVLMVSIFSFIYALGNLDRIARIFNSKFTWWITSVFTMYMFYGLALPKYNYFNYDYILFIFLIIFNIIFLFNNMKKIELVNIVCKACALGTVFICIFIFIQEKANIFSGGIRIGESASGNVTVLSAYLGILSLPCVYMYIYNKKKRYLAIYLLQICFMLLTGSKKSFIYIFMGSGMFLLLKNGIKIHKYIIPTIILIIFLAFIFNNEYFYNIIGYRIVDFLGGIGFNIEGANYSYSTDARMNMVELGLEAFKTHPFFGGGWYYFSEYTGIGSYSHNNFIEILVTYGIFGFLLYYGMYFFIIVKLIKIIKKEDIAKLFFVLNTCILLADNTGISFSQYAINYIVLLITWVYLVDNSKLKQNIKLIESRRVRENEY